MIRIFFLIVFLLSMTAFAFPSEADLPEEHLVHSSLPDPGMQRPSGGHLLPTYIADLPDNPVFFKIDQGFSFGRILDQRMSNLHYAGPGGVLGFSRHAQSARHISEIGFARAAFHQTEPGHESTTVYNPSFGISYMYLRRMPLDASLDLFLGGKTALSGNLRIAPTMGNSFLYGDFIAELKPRARVEHGAYFFGRDWQFDYSLGFAIFGYGVRIPEYGPSYQIAEDGGSTIGSRETGYLHPGNYAHLVTGAFLREPIGGDHNPNWLRVGYVWDYYRLSGDHDLNVYNASHQLVLELYFMVN